MNSIYNKLLEYYHLSDEEFKFLSKPLSEVVLKDPTTINGMKEAVDRIKRSIKAKEKIIIYGDYDCDGISATSIMVKTFSKLNYPVAYYIPSRYMDGYGINVENVSKIAKAGYKLIITVDNGISANEAIDKAKELGIDVIVVDHHEVPVEKVNAFSIIHPIVSKISPIVGSGGYMSLFLSAGLLGYYDDYLVTLAGLSTISDLMELKDYNRDVVRLALNNLETKHYPSLMMLLDNPSLISEKSLALKIAPKINSIGRMQEDTSINRLVKYLTSESPEEIANIKEWIISTNEERKNLTKEAIKTLPLLDNLSGICLLTDMKEGLIGLIANRVMNDKKVPVIVFTNDDKDPTILKGSIRSKEGFNVVKAFKSLDKYLLTGGGHALAGGLSIKKADFENFKTDFENLCRQYPIEEENEQTIKISLTDITLDNYKILRSFAPFGMGFKEPTFEIDSLPTRSLSFISQGKHLSTPLSIKSKILGFNLNEGEIKANKTINIFGNFNLSEYRNVQTLEFRISKYTK